MHTFSSAGNAFGPGAGSPPGARAATAPGPLCHCGSSKGPRIEIRKRLSSLYVMCIKCHCHQVLPFPISMFLDFLLYSSHSHCFSFSSAASPSCPLSSPSSSRSPSSSYPHSPYSFPSDSLLTPSPYTSPFPLTFPSQHSLAFDSVSFLLYFYLHINLHSLIPSSVLTFPFNFPLPLAFCAPPFPLPLWQLPHAWGVHCGKIG